MTVHKYLKAFQLRLDRCMGLCLAGRFTLRGRCGRSSHHSLEELIRDHFTQYSDVRHPCRQTMSLALSALGGKPATIWETGSSAWGTNSSQLFDSYVHHFGGTFDSVDIRVCPAWHLRKFCGARTTLHCNDSVAFLRMMAKKEKRVDLLYLDSWDIDWNNPFPSALHGLSEFIAALPCLQSGSLLLIDDTPADESAMVMTQPSHVEAFSAFQAANGYAPGKGALINLYMQATGIGRLLAHSYQALWQIL